MTKTVSRIWLAAYAAVVIIGGLLTGAALANLTINLLTNHL